MEIEVDTTKTATKNASELYAKAKKLESKLEKAKTVLEELKVKLGDIKIQSVKEKDVLKVRKELKWYEKFRWFMSSTGKLVIGGRDATSNEVLMKKQTSDEWTVFHAEITGAPFFVIRGNPEEADIREAAQAAGIFSKAWSKGYGSVSVYYTLRSQFSKTAKSGEYISKGAFVVRGKREWKKVTLQASVGVKDGQVTCGPHDAIESWAEKFVRIEPGDKKPGEITKKISHTLGVDPDEIQRALPPGKSKIREKRG